MIGAIMAAALTAACGDSQDGTPTPTAASPTATDATATAATPTPTVTTSPEQQLLEQAVLQVEEVPGALQRIDAGTSTNEDIAAEAENPEEELARLESMGRLLGYGVNFIPGPESEPAVNTIAMNSAASLYQTPDGASTSFAEDAQKSRAADWPAAYPDLVGLEVREIDRPDLADEVLWIRITGIREDEGDSRFIEDFVVLRRDRLRGFLRVASFVPTSIDPDTLLAGTAALATRQVERMDAALSEG